MKDKYGHAYSVYLWHEMSTDVSSGVKTWVVYQIIQMSF